MIIPQLDKGKPKKDNEEKPQIPKTASDLQRLKLEKLMKNPVSFEELFYYEIFIIYLYLFIRFLLPLDYPKKTRDCQLLNPSCYG